MITGATNGIGRATARILAGKGAKVVFTYRNRQRADETLTEIRKAHQNADVSALEVDLADLASVRKLAENFKAEHSRLDILINNAGAFFDKRLETKDGFEMTIGLNHLSHFVLTHDLIDLLLASTPARIINLSSAAQSQGKLMWDDLMMKEKYSGFAAYCQSKLMNILFTKELHRRYYEKGITTYAVHPGVVNTGFGANTSGIFKFLINLGRPFMRNPDKGAATSVHVATSDAVVAKSGEYWADKRIKKVNALANDRKNWEKLWSVSEELTGVSWK